MVKAKADEIALKLGIGFKCTNGWQQRLKESWNIASQSVSGRGASGDVDPA
jgi:hypothetical protein